MAESNHTSNADVLMHIIEMQSAQIKALTESNNKLLESNNKLIETVSELKEVIDRQSAQIDDLLNKKGGGKKDSHNSSKPPSSDGYSKKPKPKSLRESKGKKQGGQTGHDGSSMKIEREPDKIVPHYPKICENCPHFRECKFEVADRRYEHDIQVTTILTEHDQYKCACPEQHCACLFGEFPDTITGTKQYGLNLSALVVALNTVGMMGIDRIHVLLNSVFQLPIATGTIVNMLTRATAAVENAVKAIRQRVETLPLLNCDETGIRVAGSLHWLHCACDPLWSFFTVHRKRGSEAMDDIGLLPSYHNLLVHDFWRSYLLYNDAEHAFCVAHICRELIYAEEELHQSWAGELKKVLLEILHRRHELENLGKTAFEPIRLMQYYCRYDRIVEEGLLQNPEPERKPGTKGRKAKGKVRALLERLRDYRNEVLRFAQNWAVPFSNNEAERSIRFCKVKQKVSGCFRTETGAEKYASFMSFISTAVKHGVGYFTAVREALLGNALEMMHQWA